MALTFTLDIKNNKMDGQKANFIQQQIRETVDQEKEGITIRMATMTCGCGTKRAIVKMYHCLYCGEWYCITCAEQHFGKTIKEYKQEK